MSVKGGGDSRRLRAVVGLCGPPRTLVRLCGRVAHRGQVMRPPAHPGRVMGLNRAPYAN